MADPKPSAWPSWLGERNLRLGAGLVLFTFVSTHFLNAAMLLFGIDFAEKARRFNGEFWEFAPVTTLLAGSLIVHMALALKRLARRRTWRMPIIEAVQTGFGLLIPFWLLRHAIGTRGVQIATDIAPSYRDSLLIFWSPGGFEQALLLLMVWIHGCIGFNMLLRIRPWYGQWRQVIYGIAILIPALALAGFLSGLREAQARFPSGYQSPEAREQFFGPAVDVAITVLWAAYALTAVAILFRIGKALTATRVLVRYSDGPTVRAKEGATLLEISRANGIPHASVCGGKARCSTCRVRILEGSAEQDVPLQAERRLLAKIGAPESVRLACQLRPKEEIYVQRLVDPGDARSGLATQNDPFYWGVERQITLMFADIRGFTTISEKNFAFDIVFALNRFQADMSAAIVRNGGRIDKYLGDGLMAIFGAEGIEGGGASQAMAAVDDMFRALDRLNAEFHALLGDDLRIGVGIHTGPAILGRIGGDSHTAALTALGDTVNLAARLEEMTKTFAAVCVVSETTLELAGLAVDQGELHEAPVRGRTLPLKIRAFRTPTDIANLCKAEVVSG